MLAAMLRGLNDWCDVLGYGGGPATTRHSPSAADDEKARVGGGRDGAKTGARWRGQNNGGGRGQQRPKEEKDERVSAMGVS